MPAWFLSRWSGFARRLRWWLVMRLVSFLLLVSLTCFASAHAQSETWIAQPPVTSAPTVSPPFIVKMDGFANASETDRRRARHIVELMAAVLDSEEFHCRVKSFDRAAAPSTKCLEDASRRRDDGKRYGFFWGDESVYGKPKTNDDVYTAIVAAIEVHSHCGKHAKGCLNNTSIYDEPLHFVHLSLDIRPSLFHPHSIGATDSNGTTRTNSHIFATWPTAHLVGHWMHEYMHVLGFDHDFDKPKHPVPGGNDRSTSVPYAVGVIACQIAAGLTGDAAQQASGDGCFNAMSGM